MNKHRAKTIRAVILNCTLKSSLHPSNTEALARPVIAELTDQGVACELIRIADHNVLNGVSTDEGPDDAWPEVHQKLLEAEILIIASPTWLGHPSSIAQKVLERMDAMISETATNGLPVAYNKVAGVICTGNEDGAHHVISEIVGGLIDIGYTVPGQAWTYWNKGPGPGKSFLETDYRHEWSITTGKTMARVLAAAAKALQTTPIPPEAYRADKE
jgi:multimeric flavodoxin WrbA